MDSGKDCKEVGFEGADDMLCGIAVVNVRGNKLNCDLPDLADYLFECSAEFSVHDLDVNFVAVVGELLHDGFVGSNAVHVAFALEWGNEDDIAVTVVGDHDGLVATACTNGEAGSVICVEFSDGFY